MSNRIAGDLKRWLARIGVAAALGAVGAVGASCSDSNAKKELSGQVEIFSWWAGEEAAPLDALLQLYVSENPKVTVVNSAVLGGAGVNAKVKLRDRMLANLPPDTFQVHAGLELIDTWVRVNQLDDADSKMLPIDFLYDEEGWRTVIHPDVIDAVSYRGHAYSIPIGIHRHNMFVYNKQIFEANGLAAPKTLEDLHAVADALVAKKITPIALGYRDPWVLTDLFLNVMVALAGPEYANDFFAGKRSADDSQVTATLAEITKIVGYASADANALDWVDACRKIHDGSAAMMFQGDWAKTVYLNQLGWKPKTDYGVIPSPGTAGIFVIVTDTFGLPRGVPDYDNAVALLRLIGSREGQTTFNALKGSMPTRLDVDPAAFDEATRDNLAEFATDVHVLSLGSAVPNDWNDTFNTVMGTFAGDHDPDPVVHFLRNQYGRLRR
jgi:glucose/mannose transport system substrate-binding protein